MDGTIALAQVSRRHRMLVIARPRPSNGQPAPATPRPTRMAKPSTVSGALAPRSRATPAPITGNREPDEESDQQLRCHRQAVLGRRCCEHETRRPLDDGTGAAADQRPGDQEQREAWCREAYGGDQQGETDEHRDRAEREDARGRQCRCRQLGCDAGREHQEQRGAGERM
jgi:hypothetical protein